MKFLKFRDLTRENEEKTLGLQYTIAERERLKALMHLIGKCIEPQNSNVISRIIQSIPKSPSERFQDIFALLLCGVKENGFFVEFGACDGIHANNTLVLEKEFGWRGILAEPDKFWGGLLQKNRSSSIDIRAVSSETGKRVDFFQSDRPGNSSPDSTHAYIGQIIESYTVETVSLLDLLLQYKAPRHIDFLSVDTEGHEREVFCNFDFDQYSFGFICVEEHEQVAPENSVQPFLEAAGYKLILPRHEGRPVPMQITGIDKFFVPNSHPFADLSWPLY